MRPEKSIFANNNFIFVAIAAIVLLFALWQIRTILMLALASIILVELFTIPIRFLMRHLGLNRPLAIFVSAIGFMVLLIILSLLVFPTLFVQSTRLAAVTIPEGIEALVEWWNSGDIFVQFPFLEGVFRNVQLTDDLINEIFKQLATALGTLGGSVVPLVGGVANSALSIIIVLFLTMYMVAEPDRYLNGLIKLTPRWYRSRMHDIIVRIDSALRAWLVITGVSMIISGVGTGMGLALIGIREWAALAVLTGALSFVPNFGPLLALIPALAVGIVQVPESVWLIVIIVYGVSFIQSQVVSPILANENMKLAPILVLIGQIVFGIFFGFIGLMLAVPMTAILVVLVDEIYVKDILGDHSTETIMEGQPQLEEELLLDGV